VPPGAAACLSVEKPRCTPITPIYSIYQCPTVKTPASPRLATPGDPRTESGRGLATRWEVAGAHGRVRGTARCGPREARGEALSEGEQESTPSPAR
jgi:hypothetical protein